MKTFFELIVARRGLVLAITALLAIGGGLSLRGLSIDAVPDISPRQVMILTQAPGLGPLEIEKLVTFPVENAMAGIEHLQQIRSTSRFGLSAVYVTFDDGIDVNTARALAFERLKTATDTMPPGVGTPQLGPVATGLGEVYQFELRGPGYTPMELHRMLQWQVAPKLKLVPGVTDVNIYGGQLETFEVRINADALRRYKLTLQQVFDAVQGNNATRGGAYIAHHDQQQVVRGLGLVDKIDDVGNIVLATGPGGIPIKVSTVGTVVKAPQVRLGAVSHDGKGETVVGVVLMQYGENASAVVERIKAAVASISKQLPPGVEIRPYYDRSALVGRTIDTVEHNLIEGAVLVVSVLLLMLGNVRAGLIVASAIPLSMLVAFTGMRFFGISGNLMSLGAIDFGLIVDGAVVMVDNILRSSAPDGQSRGSTVAAAAAAVAKPIIIAVSIIMIVYLPILSLGSIEGKMFRPMAETVILALLGSLLLTLTVIPALAALLIRRSTKPQRETLLVRGLTAVYRPALGFSSTHPFLVTSTALVVFAVSVAFATQLGGNFIPQLSEGSIVITSEKLPGIDIEASLRTVDKIEKIIRRFPEVDHVVSLTGSAAIPTDPMGVESTDSFISLKPRSTWKGVTSQDELVGQLSKALSAALPGVAFNFSQPIQMRMDDLLQGVKADIGILIYGDDLATLHKLADQVVQTVQPIQGAADVKAEQQGGLPYLTVQVDRQAVARYGMNVQEVLNVVEAIGGHHAGTVYGSDNSETDIVVRWPAADRASIETIRNLPVFGISGKIVPLAEVAHVTLADGPAQISREKLQRRISITVNLRGRDAASFVKEAQAAVNAKVKLPPRYSVTWNGQFQNMQDADARLVVVVPVAMVVIFLMLLATFGDLRLALLIFLLVPISASGGILALVIRGMPFSISAAIGFIATFGIAILNGVVLTEQIKALRENGHAALEAAREAALRRMRPVMMTASVATLGFLPMAISTTAGAEVQRPLATVVIGGLITATALTLLVLPALYPIADRLFRGRAEPAAAPDEIEGEEPYRAAAE